MTVRRIGQLAIGLALAAVVVARIAREPDDDRISKQFAAQDPTAWVSIVDPARATPGYTLDVYRRRLPYLYDLSGRVVHAWPELGVVGRARLDASCNLLVIGTDDRIEEYTWEGERRFRFELPDGHEPHHDVIKLANGREPRLGRRLSVYSASIQPTWRADG